MKALVGAFNQEKALVGAFSVIVQPVVEPMKHYTALILINNVAQSSPSFFSLSCSLNLSSNRESSDMRSVRAFMKASLGV